MAGYDLLSCLEKRDLLNESVVSVDKLLEWGRLYEEAGYLADAVDFFEKAGARDDLNRLLDGAKGDGDLFLFNRICRILKIEPASDDWLVLGNRAEERGKLTFAREAYRRGGKEVSEPQADH